jgi:hypothetical protein
MVNTEAIHWYQPDQTERRDLIASWEGVVVTEDIIDDILADFRVMTRCKNARALGQTVDDLGRYQYLFAIHPNEEENFADARFDTRYRGEGFAWAKEVCFFNDW